MSDDRTSDGQRGTAEGRVCTGDADVDAAIARLADLDELPTGEHVAVFEDVHASLHQKLADMDGS